MAAMAKHVRQYEKCGCRQTLSARDAAQKFAASAQPDLDRS